MPAADRLATLVEHLVEHHHAYARRALPYIVPLLAKVAGFHGKRNGNLRALCDAGLELADALEAHLEEQERELFPAVLREARVESLGGELERMCRRHLEVGSLFARVRSLSDGYVAPAWGSHGYRTLMEELEALEDHVLEHMHLADFALFPRPPWRLAA